MNLVIVFNALSAIVFAYATNTTTTKPFKRFDLRPTESMVDFFRQEIVRSINYIWKNFKKHHYSASDSKVLRQFDNIDSKIQMVEKNLNHGVLTLFAPSWTYTLVEAEIAKLNELYKEFTRFYKANKNVLVETRKALLSLAERFRDAYSGIPNSLKLIRKYLTTKKEADNVIHFIIKQSKKEICNLKQSAYQTAYNLYNLISITEIKAYVLIQFGYMILTVFNKGNYKQEGILAMANFENSTNEQVEKFRSIMPKASRSYFLCDPKKFEEGVTYSKLVRLLVGYVENERNMHDHGFCTRKCRHYKNGKYITCYKRRDELCRYQVPCKGRIRHCKFYKSSMTVCLSKDATRRYEWVKLHGGDLLGKENYCPYENTYTAHSWSRFFTDCDYCICICEEAEWLSDKFFSLRGVTSDVEENKVVTGVRILKKRRIIHLQIQQSVLTPRGTIDKSTSSWKPIEEFSLTDRNVIHSQDYFTMAYYRRILYLNAAIGPPETVVTGVRFQKTASYLSLAVRVTPINFATGELGPESSSTWISNLRLTYKEIHMHSPDIPIKRGPHYKTSLYDQYIKFTHSDLDLDAAQSTVPYLDSQETTMEFPLSGLGLAYRSASRSGGFITPTLLSYEYAKHLSYE